MTLACMQASRKTAELDSARATPAVVLHDESHHPHTACITNKQLQRSTQLLPPSPLKTLSHPTHKCDSGLKQQEHVTTYIAGQL
jgi:hypothetical protein